MTLRLLCLASLLIGCGANVRDAIMPPSTLPESANETEAEQATPFLGNGSGVRRIDAWLP